MSPFLSFAIRLDVAGQYADRLSSSQHYGQ
jgi:hypothetical protein